MSFLPWLVKVKNSVMLLLIMFKQIFDNQATIITPNQRLALYLQQEYDLAQQRLGKISWPSKSIFSLNGWLKNLWQANNPIKILLNSHQEQIIWENIIQPFSVSKPVQEAWRLAKLWELDLTKIANASEDEQAFLVWAEKMEEQLAVNNWLDQASIIPELAKLAVVDPLAQHLIFFGFEQSAIYPQLKNFLILLAKQGVKIEYQNLKCEGSSQALQLAVSNTEQELTNMALWAKQIIAASPGVLVGCVIPDLNNLRSQVEPTFNKIIPAKFDISLGKPFSDYPIIYDALLILSLAQEQISSEQLNLLLHSPFIAAIADEHLNRCALNAKLQPTIVDTITIREILAAAKNSEQPYHAPLLAELLAKYLLVARSKNGTKTINVWASYFSELLAAVGWPGDRELTADESQQIERWQKMLSEEFISIGLISQQLTFSQALRHLKVIAAQIIFQAAKPPTPVKILGVLEAAGLKFDYLWVMGLTDETWPPAPSPNPFLPVKLQKQLKMPHSCAERELQFCRELITRFANSAKEVIFSYSMAAKDQILRPSNLIKSFRLAAWQAQNFNNIYQPIVLETLSDEIAPVLWERAEIKGGSKIFKLQAACPFRAFVECRLGAVAGEVAQLGLSSKERGILVHSMLAAVWNQIGTQQQLWAYTESELAQIINNSVTASLYALKKSAVRQKQFKAIEINRLTKMLWDWLSLEKQRLPFKVLQHEAQAKVKIGALPEITVRIDRIDQMPDGTLIIFDYKTGRVSKNVWLTERPDDPQLPLYAVTSELPIAGIVFAQIKNGELKFEGITQAEQIPEVEIDPNWEALQADWRTILAKLANEFVQGKAQVDPKEPGKTCRYCHLASLCRINES
jgi:ATP-dependent helicase/nuclease subunit B